MLRRDLLEIEEAVNDLVTIEISQSMFDALVSFAYNVGVGNLRRSTPLRKLNQGDIQGTAASYCAGTGREVVCCRD